MALILGDEQDGGQFPCGGEEGHYGTQNVLGNFTSQKAPPPLLLLIETGKETEAKSGNGLSQPQSHQAGLEPSSRDTQSWELPPWPA